MDLPAWLADRSERVDRVLEGCLPPADAPPAALHAAMRHLLFPGGKRLRPALALAAAEAVGAPPERALPVAAAVELIHTYSLVHDDLPCMDDDAERRGRPTVHVAWDEATAVLAGDALQAAAFEALSAGAPEASAEALRECVRELAQAAGSRELVGGQWDDLHLESAQTDAGSVEAIHRRKTAALFTAAVVGGGRLAGADETALARLRRFGGALGLAFQIADDLLDEASGEPCSMLRALGPEAARQRAEALLADALDALEPFGEPGEPLRELARFAVRRER